MIRGEVPLQRDLQVRLSGALHQQRRQLPGLDADFQTQFDARFRRLHPRQRAVHTEGDPLDGTDDPLEFRGREADAFERLAGFGLHEKRAPVRQLDRHNPRLRIHDPLPFSVRFALKKLTSVVTRAESSIQCRISRILILWFPGRCLLALGHFSVRFKHLTTTQQLAETAGRCGASASESAEGKHRRNTGQNFFFRSSRISGWNC